MIPGGTMTVLTRVICLFRAYACIRLHSNACLGGVISLPCPNPLPVATIQMPLTRIRLHTLAADRLQLHTVHTFAMHASACIRQHISAYTPMQLHPTPFLSLLSQN